jgi:hypothetical protein
MNRTWFDYLWKQLLAGKKVLLGSTAEPEAEGNWRYYLDFEEKLIFEHKENGKWVIKKCIDRQKNEE